MVSIAPFAMSMATGSISANSNAITGKQSSKPNANGPAQAQVPLPKNTTKDPEDRAQLDKALNAIATDPDGRILLKEASRRGVTIGVGELPENILGRYKRGDNRIIIRPYEDDGKPHTGPGADPDLSIATTVHELVHAVTPKNKNSKTEEGMASVIGHEIESSIGPNGKSLSYEKKNNIFTNYLNNPHYSDLKTDNGIRTDLNNLGLNMPRFGIQPRGAQGVVRVTLDRSA